MLVHACRRCGFQSQIQEDYLNHLWEQQHQNVSRSSFLKWSYTDNLRSVVIYAPSTPYPLPSDVIALFCRQSITVTDFVCWTDRPQNFVIQFSHKEDAERMLTLFRQQSPDLTFGGNTLGLRRKCDIEDFEWPSLIGDGTARTGSSENPVLIELSDDSNDSNDPTRENGTEATNGNGSTNDINGSENGVLENMDDTPSTSSTASTRNGRKDSLTEDDTSSTVDDPNVVVEIETKISDEFRSTFLDKMKRKRRKTEDDKKSVEKHVQLLLSKWLEVYVDFHNKLWPLCFVARNKKMQTNRNEVGFEAKFVCHCLKTKYSEWLDTIKEEKREINIDKIASDFLSILSSDEKADERLNKIRKLVEHNERSPALKFKCHILVTFSDSGNAIAKLKFHKIEGGNIRSKMNVVEKVFRRLFRKYEILRIKEWSPAESEKVQVKKEQGGGESSWTQIITIDE